MISLGEYSAADGAGKPSDAARPSLSRESVAGCFAGGEAIDTWEHGRIANMTRRVLLYPGDDGYMVAEVPSLPGCVSQGKTREEALANVREAISLHEEVLRERGEPVPDDQTEIVEVAA